MICALAFGLALGLLGLVIGLLIGTFARDEQDGHARRARRGVRWPEEYSPEDDR